jgi:hypothetical protein
MKNLPSVEILEILRRVIDFPMETPEERAREALKALQKANRYWPTDA